MVTQTAAPFTHSHTHRPKPYHPPPYPGRHRPRVDHLHPRRRCRHPQPEFRIASREACGSCRDGDAIPHAVRRDRIHLLVGTGDTATVQPQEPHAYQMHSGSHDSYDLSLEPGSHDSYDLSLEPGSHDSYDLSNLSPDPMTPMTFHLSPDPITFDLSPDPLHRWDPP